MRRISILLVAVSIAVLAPPARATPGQLDPFFSGNGKQTAFSNGATGYAVAVDKQGRILVAGYTLGAKTDLALARFLPNGEPDPDFGGGDGRVVTNLGGTDYGFDVALQSDGKIVVAGERDFNDRSQFAVARYGIRGVLDKSFSKDGKNFTGFGKKYQGASAVVIGAGGNIILGGYTSNGSTSRWALARYRPNGSLDPHFGKSGKVTTDVSPTIEQIQDLGLAPGGKIVVAGYAETSLTPRFAIGQYLSGGKLDRSFGHEGITTLDMTKGSDTAYGLARQSDGKLIVVGYVNRGGASDWGMARFGAKGRLDKTFGHKGKVITAFGPAYDYAYDVAVQSNGKIVVVGQATRNTAEFGLVRYKPNGGRDLTFGGDGKVLTDFFLGDDVARGATLQSNGKIVVAGTAGGAHKSRLAVARYRNT